MYILFLSLVVRYLVLVSVLLANSMLSLFFFFTNSCEEFPVKYVCPFTFSFISTALICVLAFFPSVYSYTESTHNPCVLYDEVEKLWTFKVRSGQYIKNSWSNSMK